jgi:hypothetical protein
MFTNKVKLSICSPPNSKTKQIIVSMAVTLTLCLRPSSTLHTLRNKKDACNAKRKQPRPKAAPTNKSKATSKQRNKKYQYTPAERLKHQNQQREIANNPGNNPNGRRSCPPTKPT